MAGENGSSTIRLSRATFRNGKLVAEDALLTGDASEFGYQAGHRVIGNRYVVCQSATVYDLAAKKVVHAFEGGRVLAVEGSQVYFVNNKVVGEQGVFRYDAASGKREKVAAPGVGRWGLRGAVSPDGTKAVVRAVKNVAVLEGREMPYGLELDRPGQPRTPLGDFAATCGTTGAGFMPDAPPGVWLDDDRFLTQTTLGTVVILDTATGKPSAVVAIIQL